MRRKIVVGLMGLLLAAGCASTQVTNTWRNPTFTGPLPRKVLVVGLLPNETVRRQVEELEAGRLQQMGIQGVPSYAVIPAGTALDRQSVTQAVQQNGFDGVLVSHYKGARENVTYSPGPGYGPYFDMWGPYGYGPGYAYVTPEYEVETSLFSTRGQGQLIWSGTSSTFSSGSNAQDVNQYVSAVIGRMQKDLSGHA